VILVVHARVGCGCYPLGRVLAAAVMALVSVAVEPGYTVAIDPGHGGSNTGAVSDSGVYEKHLVLDIGRRIERKLRAGGKVTPVLCRSKDVRVEVRARVRCANQARARLFISLHANASPKDKRGSQRGFELYVPPVADVDTDARAAAALAPDAAEAAWAASRVRAAAAEGPAAAQRIAWRLGDALGLDRDRGIKQAGALLDVLQGLTMPGVLVEIGFIDHAEEGPFIVSEDGRETIATALAKAIEDLRARELRGRRDPAITSRRPPPGGAPAVERTPDP
jgi:N-acetylmuramoyl-L-alanine amidase